MRRSPQPITHHPSQTQESKQDTLSYLIKSFLETKRSQETRRAYKREISSFFDQIQSTNQTTKLSNISKSFLNIPFSTMCDHVTQYIENNKEIDPHTHHITNPRSINRKLYALSSFFQYLIKKHEYQGNPVRILEPVPVPKKSSTPSPSTQEIKKLFHFLRSYREEGIQQHRNTLLIMMMFLLALRRSEVINLKWSNINTEKKTITLIQKGAIEKHLPIPKVLFNQLMTFQTILKKESKRIDYIFSNLRDNQNRPLSQTATYNITKTIIKHLFPSKNYSPHSFRKAFIEQALSRNNDLISIANATGHSSIEMVKYYDTRDEIENNAIHDVADLANW